MNTLTEEEMLIIQKTANGQTAKQIAAALNVQENVICHRRHSIYVKCKVPNAPALVDWAYQKGILKVTCS